MDMPEVKSFNAELSGLYDNKPPISKAKMSAITKGAIKAIKFYKHVVHSVEKFIQKCKPEYKVPGLYVIDSIVRQSRHQFGQEKDVFAPRFAKNMQQTFANLFRCPPEDKRNIIRVLNLWQKNNVFTSQVIQPLLDMADPNHPLHQEIQQQQNNTANGSSLNLSHNTSDNKVSPGPSQHSPNMSSPMDGNQFQDEPSGPPNMKFNRKLLNDFEYESEDEPMILDPPLPTSHSGHTSHSTHTSHSHAHTNQQQPSSNPSDAMASILTNPEIMRQLQSLQAQMSLMTGMQIPNLMPMMSDMQLQPNQNQPALPFLSNQDQQNDAKEDMANESDIEFVDAGPQVIEIPDANDSRSPSPKSRRHHSRSKSPRRRGRHSRTRTRSRSPRRRRDRERDRERERDRHVDDRSDDVRRIFCFLEVLLEEKQEREKEREREKDKTAKEREADREKQKEREKRGLPPIKKENLSVCSTTLWVGHVSKLATPEELSDIFGGLGGVVSIDVVPPRGCAFVVMETRRDAYKALTKLNKHKLHSKEITVAWAPGKGVKGREWKEQWEAELGVSYLPWASLHARWLLGELQLDALEDGGMVDEETLPPWLPPRITPKTMMESMSLMGIPPGMISLPPGMPPSMRPQLPPDMAAAALGSPANITRMPPPGMAGGLPPGMPPGLPPGIRPPNMTGVPGMPDGGMPPTGPMIRFPPGMPPQAMGQPGMVGGFLPGLLGVGGMPNMGMPNMPNISNMPMFAPVMPQHAPPSLQLPQRPSEGNDDDAMDLDTEDMHHDDTNRDTSESLPSTLLPDQIQALLSKPPPKFNASELPPRFNASEQSPFQTNDEKQEDDRKNDRERDRRDRDRNERDRRGDRRDRDRDRRGSDSRNERGNEQRNERGNERGNERVNDRRDRGNERDREGGGGREERRDRERGRDRRDRAAAAAVRDNNNDRNREKSPRPAAASEAPEKSLQERLWEMANGKPAARADDKPRDEYTESREQHNDNTERIRTTDNESPGAGPAGDGPEWGAPPRPTHGAPPFRPDMRMRGPPNVSRPGGPWMDGPAGPPGPFGGRFNGMGPFKRPPFERPPFDGMPPRFERPPFRMPFDMSRPPFDGPRSLFEGPRPPFDGMRPPFNGPRPAYDKPRPAYDGPRPAYDGPPFDQPGFEPEIFDRNRRFEERDQFDRSWERREWDDRRRPRDDGSRDRPRDRRRATDDKRPQRDDRSGSRDDRPPHRDDRHRDDRNAPRDDRSAPKDDRNAPRDDRSALKDDRNAPRDDRSAPKDDRNAPRDDRSMPKFDRTAPKDDRSVPNDRSAPRDDRSAPRDDKNLRERSAPKDERPATDRSAPKDEKSGPPDEKPSRDERRRDRQDRKSRWGAESVAKPEPALMPDDLQYKLQQTIASFPQSDTETQPVLPTTVPTDTPRQFVAAEVPEAVRSPRRDESMGDSEHLEHALQNVEMELPQSGPEEPKGFETAKFPQSDQQDSKQSFESESTKQSYETESSPQTEEGFPAAMEIVPEKPVPDLYDDSATYVGIETNFAKPIPEEMIAKLNDPTPEPSTDDIFEEAAGENAADSKGA